MINVWAVRKHQGSDRGGQGDTGAQVKPGVRGHQGSPGVWEHQESRDMGTTGVPVNQAQECQPLGCQDHAIPGLLGDSH